MNKEFYQRQLFIKYLNNECNSEELELVFQLLQKNNSAKILQNLIREEFAKEESSLEIPANQLEPELFECIRSRIKLTPNKSQSRNKFSGYYQSAYKFAAGFILLAVTSVLIYFFWGIAGTTTISSEFGETLTFTLPDNSKVVLNGNSTIRFNKSWDSREIRRVYLEGEAFFSVVHTNSNQKFMVETGDISVEALGTEFNVFSRRSRTQVVLNSGKLKLDFQSRKIEQEIILQPGEMVEYEATNDEYNRTLVEPENYSSWKEHKLVFDNSSLLEITQQVEDIYGYKIKYGPEVDMNRKLSGTIPNDDIQVLLRALEYYGINIIYDENLNPD